MSRTTQNLTVSGGGAGPTVAPPLSEVSLVACPYAKSIRGTVSHCSLVNKKVSTLRYPCKGNYRRCPIYIRYGARAARPAARPRQQAQPRREQVEAQSRQAAAPQPAAQAAPSVNVREAPPAPRGTTARGELRPSEALCDSLILASLTVAGRSIGVYRGPLEGLVRELEGKYERGKFVFVVGTVGGYKFRALYAGGVVTYSFAREAPICGQDAEKLLGQLRGEYLDAVLYEIDWNNIPLWRDRIASEIGM